MSVPEFLASSHFYSTFSCTTVDDILTNLHTILTVTNDPAWTEPSADTFQSPTDDAGRWYSVKPEKSSDTRIKFTTKDQYGTTIGVYAFDIDAAGTNISIMSGSHHLWINSARGTPEGFRSGLVDCSPRAQDAWTQYTYCGGYRDGSGNGTGDNIGYLDMTGNDWNYAWVVVLLSEAGNYVNTTPAGDNVFYPVFLRNGSNQLVGRMYQAWICPSSLGIGSEVDVAIDNGVSAKFRVIACATWGLHRICVRAD
jgi:hypothetical protein